MIDTPKDIEQKQREILLAKTSTERSAIGMETIRFGRQIVEDSIRERHPGISETELKIAVFRRCYENSFSPKDIDLIISIPFGNTQENQIIGIEGNFQLNIIPVIRYELSPETGRDPAYDLMGDMKYH